MPHPSKLKLPEWLDTDQKWGEIVQYCDHPIKFSLLASDLLRNKIFESTDHFWIVLYLLSEDIQERNGINVISELHCYRELAFQKPYYLEIKEKRQTSERLFSLFDKAEISQKNCQENVGDKSSSDSDSDFGDIVFDHSEVESKYKCECEQNCT